MNILKVINNNIVSALDNNEEIIVMGRGLGFQAKPGQLVKDDKIEKMIK